MATTSFTELDVWKKAHQAVLVVYRMTKDFPKEERYGLSAQMRNAAVSVPANIAEGYGRRSPNDKARFYNISQGSTEELRYYSILARDLEYVRGDSRLDALLKDVSQMLRKLSKSTVRDS